MRRCLLHPENTCPARKGSDTCVCVPPGFDPDEWRAMEPQERKAMADGATDVLLQAIVCVLSGSKE